MPEHPSNRVRAFLRQELPRWRAEGIIDARVEGVLSERYGLADRDAAGFALAALYVLAACLVGGGIISLVAWHWDDMSRWSRLMLLGAALVMAHAAGYRMWQVTRRQPRLGHAISLLGTIIFGASIGLVAQIFQVSGPWYAAFGAWALGAVLAGTVLPSLPALCLASFLALFVWGPGFIPDHARFGDVIAWVVGGTSMVLAFRFRSRVLFVVSTAGLAIVLALAAAHEGGGGSVDFPHVPVAALLTMAAAACSFGVWGSVGVALRFAPAAAWLGRLGFYVLGYWLSFERAAKEALGHPAGWSREWVSCAGPPAVAAIALLVTARRAPSRIAPLRITAAVVAAYALLFPITAQLQHHPLYLAGLGNVALVVVAAAWIAHGLGSRSRASFWEGLALVGVVAISRFFEIESLLWLKGAGFIASGMAVVAAALAFERRLHDQTLEARHE